VTETLPAVLHHAYFALRVLFACNHEHCFSGAKGDTSSF